MIMLKENKRRIISLILVIFILMTSIPIPVIAEEIQNSDASQGVLSEGGTVGANEDKSGNDNGSLNENETEEGAVESEVGVDGDIESESGTDSEDEQSSEELDNEVNLLGEEALSEEGKFKVALRWGGTSNPAYSWDATKSENRVIKLTFYYQNEVTPRAYAPGELVVTIPGIGKLNRNSTVKAMDIAADVFGATEQKRDWSYKYDAATDTYTFYNNHAIEQGETFNGSFEMLYEFTSRNCINDYAQTLKATLTAGEQTIESQELSLDFTSKRDTFYINKSAKSLVSGDGLSKYVAEGKTVSDYAWVQYTFRYNTQELNARALQSRFLVDTLPAGCIVARDTNVIKNEDGTVTYTVMEMPVSENYVRESSIIVGYPEEYVGQTIDNTVYLNGTYKDEEEEIALAQSTVQVELKKIQNQTVGIVAGKYVSPDYIYREALGNDINFSASLYATATTNAEDEGYTVSVTDDLLEIYTPASTEAGTEATYHTLTDDEYKFTSVIVPGTSNFTNANGYTLTPGDYTVKIYALYKKDVNTRGLNEYTLIHEGKWEDSSITKTLEEDTVAIRAEVSGLKESVKSFYISARGIINVSENVANAVYDNPSYIVNYQFTELKDKDGNSLIGDIAEENYSQTRLYERDSSIYGKGVLRAQDTISIREYIPPQPSPGYYYARADIEPFLVDENVENFVTKLHHSAQVYNTHKEEISKVEVHGVVAKEELETYLETLQLTQSGLKFKNEVSSDTDLVDYLMERATITKEGTEISITFDFSDNPIVSTNFSIGFTVDSKLKYEEYYESTNPSYTVRTYAYLNNGNLNPQSTVTHNGKTMATASDSESILLALASHQQLIKMVKTQYTDDFVQENAVAPMNTEYTYRLKLRNGYNTLVNTEIVDILEHSELTVVDGENPYPASEWYGTFRSVNVTQIENQGLGTKVYYANTLTPDENSWTLMESYENGIWTTANEVKAIKVEIEGEIVENSIIYVDVNMLAPNDKTLEDKKAYNSYLISSDAIDLYTGMQSSYMKNMPSNNVDVRLVQKEYNLEITKTDALSGSKLSGVIFGVYDTEGNKLMSNLTGVLGITELKGLKEGTYIIKEELVPPGYEKVFDELILTIQDGAYTTKEIYEGTEKEGVSGEATLEGKIPTIKLNIENPRAKGSITVYKKDECLNSNKEEISLSGAKFELLDTEGNLIAEGTTDINGNIVFEDLDWGKTYIIKEKTSPTGYEVIETSVNTYLSKLNKDKTVTIENIRREGTVILTKQDEKDKTKLLGAVYGLYAKNNIYNKEGNIVHEPDTLIEEQTTNEEGQVIFENLIWGDYYIQEISTVYGYELSEVKHEFTVSAETVENTIEKTENEERRSANLQLIKIDDKGNFLPGVEFGLYTEEGKEVVIKDPETGEQIAHITDANGQLNIQGIEWGNYYIQELKVPEGYELSSIKYLFTVDRETFKTGNNTVTIVKNEETDEEISIIRNNRKKGKASLTKYACDAEGNETTNILEGAVYELYSSDGTLVGEYTTDENGKITVENLDWDSYYFLEKEAPDGFSLSDKKIAFVINSKNADFEQELTAYDKQESGEIKINKTIKADSLYGAHGDSTFIFKIVGKDENGDEKVTLYRTVTFTEQDKETQDENGNITKTITITDIEPYNYEITEEENYRYDLSTITPVTNAEVNGEIGLINLIQATENKGEISFSNEKTSNSLLTDNGLITNTAQNEYYLIGIGVEVKEGTHEMGIEITASDFSYTLYYSGGQEQSIDAESLDSVTINGGATYTEDLVGNHIANVQVTYNGKTYNAEVPIKWVTPSDYFIYTTINSTAKTIAITGINTKYTSPEVLYIPSEYNGYRVVQLGTGSNSSDRLKNISNVKTVEIEDGIERINKYAFLNYSNIKDIKLPKSLKSIGDYAFQNCKNLTYVSLSENVTSIGKHAFHYCNNLINIEVEEDNECYISVNGILYNKDKTILIKYPEGKKDLTEYEVPNSVIHIEDNAFYKCDTLKSIDLSNTQLQNIGNYAFSECSMLENIDFSNTAITSIGVGAFYKCSMLKSIDLSNTQIENINNYTFEYCSNLTTVNLSNTPIITINYSAFEQCGKLESIDLSSTQIKTIGGRAFLSCKDLTSIKLPDSVTNIGNSAFSSCSSLTEIYIPESVTSIGSSAFSSCSSLTDIYIPESVTSIGDGVFNYCSGLIRINVAQNNEYYLSIDGVLYNKDKTILIKYPEEKKDLTEYIIPESVISIGNNAFYDGTTLTNINIPESVTSIGASAFYGCTSLKNIDLSNTSITSINTTTFYRCSNLISIKLPDTLTNIGKMAFQECRSLSSIDIPKSISTIGNQAFLRCDKLESIDLSNTQIKSIGDNMFRYCYKLTSIYLPASVKNIGIYAFDSCTALTTINYYGTEEQFAAITVGPSNNAFSNATVNYITE